MMKEAKFLLCGRDPDNWNSLAIEGHISLSKARKAAKKKKNWKEMSIWQRVWDEKN